MSCRISGNSFLLENVYVEKVATSAGKIEGQGPIGNYFDIVYHDHYLGKDSYELAEIAMLDDACDIVMQKAKIKQDDIDLFIGGDLNNQITAINYFCKRIKRPLYGIYSACATMGQGIQQASLFLENKSMERILVMVSSHNACAERQFRYPNEYGIQKPITTTFTATGAVSVLLTNSPTKVRIGAITMGRVIDMLQTNPNDMGKAMAPSAFDTLKNHLKDLNRSADYYDLIVTGDLSNYGKNIMEVLMDRDGMKAKQYHDCGCLLYETTQVVFQGGSGPTCSALVTFGYLYQKLLQGSYQKILVLPTGALLNPIMTNQKQSIPCICHAFSLEVTQ
ncbi:stage V sporulation protein AD [Tannockella kyphosi]|uniref:stage V sporulation protein AD n=1 Tax=Tannockella kyphosi TaxID=2899121 RepID=UPI0020137DBC|nr:stage V sporulation protein AD [Tannockella kyphosi]